MPQFNATDAIFFGFRVVKRDPTLLIALAVLTAVVGAVGTQLIWRELVDFMVGVEALSQASQSDPEAALAQMADLYGGFFGSPAVLAFILVSLVVALVTQGAILRSLVLDRREGWVMGLQLGGDELRILVVTIVVWLLVSLAYVVAVIAAVVVSGVFGALSAALGGVVGLVAVCAAMLGVALVGVRFSAAAPASVGEGKFVVFGSWRLTKGRMWSLLGAYVVLFFLMIVYVLVILVLSTLVAPQATALSQGLTPVTALEDAGAAFRSPGYILLTIIQSALNVIVAAAWAGPGAYAYRMLGGAVGYPNASPPSADVPPAKPPLVS